MHEAGIPNKSLVVLAAILHSRVTYCFVCKAENLFFQFRKYRLSLQIANLSFLLLDIPAMALSHIDFVLFGCVTVICPSV